MNDRLHAANLLMVEVILAADDRVSNPIGVPRMLMAILGVLVVGAAVYYGSRGSRRRR